MRAERIPPPEPTKRKKKRPKKRNVISTGNRQMVNRDERTTKLVVALISAMFITLAIGTIHGYLTTERPPTMGVNLITATAPEMNQGLVIRSEVVYTTDLPGAFTFYVEEKSRIRPNTLVATVRNAPVVAQLEEENDELTLMALNLQSNSGIVSPQTQNAELVNDYIREITNQNIHRITDPEAARRFADEINHQISVRNTLLLSDTRGQITPLAAQNERNLNLISINQSQVMANTGGLISFSVDGLEHLTAENVRYLSYEMMGQILYEEMYHSYETGNGVFRVVDSNVWQIAAFIDNASAVDLSVNQALPIFIETDTGFREISATISYLEMESQATLVVFTLRDFLQDHLNDRVVSFTLDPREFRGLQVAHSAIAHRTLLSIPVDYVYVTEDEVERHYIFRQGHLGEVERLFIIPRVTRNQDMSEDYIYIVQDFRNIAIGDTIVLNGQSHVINQLITDTGVFRANNGVAAFTSIDTRHMVSMEDYVILDLELNQGRGGLNVHDRIVEDVHHYIIYDGRNVF